MNDTHKCSCRIPSSILKVFHCHSYKRVLYVTSSYWNVSLVVATLLISLESTRVTRSEYWGYETSPWREGSGGESDGMTPPPSTMFLRSSQTSFLHRVVILSHLPITLSPPVFFTQHPPSPAWMNAMNMTMMNFWSISCVKPAVVVITASNQPGQAQK